MSTDPGPAPFLSVLMPVYNEAATVATVVERVLAVDWPCSVELVIVDDGSVDGTARVLAALDDPRVRLQRRTGATPARALRCAPRPPRRRAST